MVFLVRSVAKVSWLLRAVVDGDWSKEDGVAAKGGAWGRW